MKRTHLQGGMVCAGVVLMLFVSAFPAQQPPPQSGRPTLTMYALLYLGDSALQKELKLTVVMITHDLDTIFRTCNRVGVIVDRHMEVDTLDGIVNNPHPWIQAYFHGERARARLERHGT